MDCPKAHDRYGKRKRFIMAKGKARFLTCKAYGKLKTLDYNPRTIDDVAFTKLCESIERDPEFMVVNKIKIDETNTVLGGNQRVRALLEIGYKEIPDEWVQMCLMPDGTPWPEEKKKRFILIDNSPAGMSGEFDYAVMEGNFDKQIMEDAGIDFSLLSENFLDEDIKSAEDEVEEGEMGERDPKLKEFVDAREESRGKVGSMTDVSFYSCGVGRSKAQRDAWSKWLEEQGIEQRFGGLYFDLCGLAAKLGVELPPLEENYPDMKPLQTLAELAMEVDGEVTDDEEEEADEEGDGEGEVDESEGGDGEISPAETLENKGENGEVDESADQEGEISPVESAETEEAKGVF